MYVHCVGMLLVQKYNEKNILKKHQADAFKNTRLSRKLKCEMYHSNMIAEIPDSILTSTHKSFGHSIHGSSG